MQYTWKKGGREGRKIVEEKKQASGMGDLVFHSKQIVLFMNPLTSVTQSSSGRLYLHKCYQRPLDSG